MEELVVSLVMAAIEGVPKIIAAVQASVTLSDEEKKALLAKLHAQLDASAAKVKAVTFKDV